MKEDTIREHYASSSLVLSLGFKFWRIKLKALKVALVMLAELCLSQTEVCGCQHSAWDFGFKFLST